MNLASLLANKCLEFLLHCDAAKGNGQPFLPAPHAGQHVPLPALLPPWSLARQEFRARCDGCRACLERCANNILILDGDGLPVVDFTRGGCDFCGACAASCSRGAYAPVQSRPAWALKARITAACLTQENVLCRTCAEHCPEEAIIFPRQVGTIGAPQILQDRCTGCGACIGPCPAGAIAMNEYADEGEEKRKPGESR